MVRRHINCDQKNSRETRAGGERNHEEIGRCWTQITPKKREFFKREAEWVGHRIDRDGIRPLQDKLEAITKINMPKNEKVNKILLGSDTILTEVYRKHISTNRYTQKTTKKSKTNKSEQNIQRRSVI